MKTVDLKAEPRQNLGTSSARKLRKEGYVPGVLYDSKGLLKHFYVRKADIHRIVFSPEFNKIILHLDGQQYECILKDFDFHPIKDEVIHFDLQGLQPGVPVKVEIPVIFNGPSEGERLGGKLIQNVRKVKVKTIPERLVNVLSVDIHHVGLGESVRVKDLKVEEGMEVLMNPNIPLATVEIPRALKAAAAAEAKAAK